MALWPQYTVGIILALKFIGDMFRITQRGPGDDGTTFATICVAVLINGGMIYALHAGGFW